MHLVLALLLQQPAAAQPATPPPPVSLERIRRGLESPPETVTVESSNPALPPIFRLEIRDRPLPYEYLWESEVVPSYVRPTRGIYHHEFLADVTPDFFRATSLHPCCPVLPVVNFIAKKLGRGRDAESQARQEVKKALKEFLDEKKRSGS